MPVKKKPAAKKPAAKKATTKKVATKKPAAKKTSTKKAVTKKPVAKKKTATKAKSKATANANQLTPDAAAKLVKRGLLIGLGAAVESGGKLTTFVNKQVKQLVDKDKFPKAKAEKFGKDITKLVQKEKKMIEAKIQDTVDGQMKKVVKSLKLVTKDDLTKLKADLKGTKKTTAKKPAAKKPAAKKAAPKKRATAKKAPAKKTTAKKTAVKKVAARTKPAAKKSVAKKSTAKK